MFCPFSVHRVERATPSPCCFVTQICTLFKMSFVEVGKAMEGAFFLDMIVFRLVTKNPSKLLPPQLEVGVSFAHRFFYVFQYKP